MRAAKIRPLSAYEVGPYMADLDAELRRQTAGIGLDILQVGGGIVDPHPRRRSPSIPAAQP